ncbi:MAG: zincin-like metallopeptidase domain-containing protein [Chitinophagales bacterium]
METNSIIKEITMKIIYLLDKVVTGDFQTWLPLSGLAYNPVTKHTYTSVNQLLLSFAIMQKNYEVNNWLTFNQIKDAGGSVLKGEKSTSVTFTDVIYFLNDQKITAKDAKRHLSEAQAKNPSITTYKEVGIKTKRFLKYYFVFNVAQTKDLPEILFTKGQEPLTEIERIAQAEHLLKQHDIICINAVGDSAHYNYVTDVIQMPFAKQFENSEHYYAVLFHELIHWTGHESRLNRLFSKKGSPDYAFEELIAELGSAFLCAHYQIPAPLTSTTAYVKSWLTVLQNDRTYLLKAMKFSDNAMSYLIEKQTICA